MSRPDEVRASLPQTVLPDAVQPEPAPGLGTRALALSALATVAGTLGWLVFALYGLFADAWIAPIALSPDSDAVIALDLQLTRQRAEMERAEAEVARIDAEIDAIDGALEQLATLRDRSRDLFAWGAELQGEEAQTLGHAMRDLREERTILDRLITGQRAEITRAQAHLTAGLIERRELESQEEALDRLALQRIANGRAISEADVRRRRADTTADQFRASIDGDAPGAARMPEIVQRHESETRLELEILRLQAERRGLVAMREVGHQSLDDLRDVMAQIEARPLYRATQTRMDVAFVPYEQLEGVMPGATIVQCEAGIFLCHDVGHIAEVVPGEVVTQDPWGEMARGRYAVLQLDDADAVQERILRVR